MRKILILLLLLPSLIGIGQKKLQLVRNSEITGIGLPDGSSRDKRFLSVTSARILLEMESKKDGTAINDVEVLYLPPTSTNNYGADSLVAAFTQAGWSMSGVERDNKYLWLIKDAKAVMVYFQMDPKQTQLYFGVAATNPFGGGQNNTSQPVNNNPATPPPVNDPNPPPIPNPPQNNYTTPPVTQTSLNMEQTSTPAFGGNGIHISTINFDDGWVSVVMADWVHVTKGDDKVFLHYSIPLPDDLRSRDANSILNHFWSILVQPRYNCSNLEYKQPEPYSYKIEYFMEADAVETQTGRNCHVGLKINIEGGIASFVEIQSASKASLHAHFSKEEAIDLMKWYNRFAISKEDLSGEWQESSGSAANYYNAYSGAYAGMAAVSISSRLVLGSDGLYTLEEKGAYGMVGSQNFFDQKKAGSYQVANWELVTFDKEGKRVAYNAYYEAVKNGRILHLQNQEFKGSQMHLVKSK